MSQSNLGIKTFPTSSVALGQFLRVRNPSSLALAGAADPSLGTLVKPVFTTDSFGAVMLGNVGGTRKMVAAGAISAGAPVYGAASGKIAATGTVFEGVALEAATADGDIIEVAENLWDVVGKVLHLRQRVTTANVNSGTTLLAAIPGLKYRVVDMALISIGGAASGATSVDIRATQSASGVNLLAAAVAGLTQNTLLRAGATNAAILAAGASFVANDVNTAITLNATGTLATSTNIDVLLSYVIEG
jgi:hypothetical protein